MPKQTFLNLNADKQANITKILLEEFSTFSLLDANVNHIVKAAGIARGSFYTYFEDMDDAYRYALEQVLKSVHNQFSSKNPYQATIDFINVVEKHQYYDFLSNYYVVDQSILEAHRHFESQFDAQKAQENLPEWLSSVAVHQLIRAYFLKPVDKHSILQTLSALQAWYEKEA